MPSAIIKTANSDVIYEKIKKLNRIFQRYSHPEITFNVSTEIETIKVRIDTPIGIQYVERFIGYHYFDIEYQPFILGDYTVVAALDHIENVVNLAPGMHLPSQYYGIEGNCNHCQTNHERHKTIIMQNLAGEFIQLGTSCVTKYLGIDASHILKLTALIAEFNELLDYQTEEYQVKCGRNEFELESFLSATSLAIELYGWHKSDAERPTKLDTVNILSDKELSGQITEKHYNEALNVIKWMLSLKDNTNSYLYNLHTIAQNGFTTQHTYGTTASAIVAYRSTIEVQNRPKVVSQHFGEVKKRYNFELEVTFVLAIPSYYGTNYMHILKDSEGNMFKWIATNGTEFETGDIVKGKATVVEHTEYRGTKQTVLQRCKFELQNVG